MVLTAEAIVLVQLGGAAPDDSGSMTRVVSGRTSGEDSSAFRGLGLHARSNRTSVYRLPYPQKSL